MSRTTISDSGTHHIFQYLYLSGIWFNNFGAIVEVVDSLFQLSQVSQNHIDRNVGELLLHPDDPFRWVCILAAGRLSFSTRKCLLGLAQNLGHGLMHLTV